MGIAWTENRIELLKQGWADGDSAAVIAARLGGVSRNAVIGKVHRLGLDGREPRQCPGTTADERIRPAPIVRTSRQLKSKPDPAALANLAKIMSAPKPQVIEHIPEPKPLMMSLLELGHRDCRYAVDGEKQHMLFCGHVTEEDSSYCAYHHKLCHGPGTRSERSVDQLLAKVA
ncbi:GcrA family cell cycle regulator [Rhizobium lentis]|uniref:GcrA family cell cycle regulator n=1 Tax=Rhizobium lentis TaxID=1138194 RepID=UPI001C8360E7|nr:GcrA family cell cycle regulator [Rhizobium lentis]